MSRFVRVDRDTAYWLPPSVREWLPKDHLARYGVDVVEALDVSGLVRRYAGRGSDAHHPGTLQVLLIARTNGLLKLGNVALDGTKVKANASRHCALSHGHALKLKPQLQAEVEQLLRLAETADASERPEGMDIPQELARREQRLARIEEAKARIEAAAAQEHEQAQALFEAKQAERERRQNAGRRPRARHRHPPARDAPDSERLNDRSAPVNTHLPPVGWR